MRVIVDHDDTQQIGVVRELTVITDLDGADWHVALCDIPDPPAWLRPGTGVSFGFKSLRRYEANGWDIVSDAIVDEISVLNLLHPGEPERKGADADSLKLLADPGGLAVSPGGEAILWAKPSAVASV